MEPQLQSERFETALAVVPTQQELTRIKKAGTQLPSAQIASALETMANFIDLDPWALSRSYSPSVEDDPRQHAVVIAFQRAMQPVIETLFPRSYLDHISSARDKRHSMSMVHLETILHLAMNNMIDTQSSFTPSMVDEYCKANLLPILATGMGNFHLAQFIAADPGIKAVAKTMFINAIQDGDADCVSKLLSATELGLEVNCSMDFESMPYERRHSTPLEAAAALGHVTVVEALIKKFNADVNYSPRTHGDDGDFHAPESLALLAAVRNEHKVPKFERLSIAEMLLDGGAGFCDRNLFRLISNGNMEFFRMIIGCRSVSRPCCFEWMKDGLFHQAASKLDFGEFNNLLFKFDLSTPEVATTVKYGGLDTSVWDIIVFNVAPLPPNIIDIFSQRGNLQGVRTLKEKGVPFTKNSLVAALRSCNSALIRYVLHQGALLDCFSVHYRTTPIAESIRSRQHYWTCRMLQLLSQRTIFTDEQSYCACLAAAAESGNKELAAELLTRKQWRSAEVLGYALYKACEADQTWISIRLLEQGALCRPSECNGVFGFTPIHDIDMGHRSFSPQDEGDSGIPSLLRSVMRNRNAVIYRALLEYGGVVSDKDMWKSKGREDLYERYDDLDCMTLAVEWGDFNILKSLISAGLRPGDALRAAVHKLNFGVVKLIIHDYKGDLDATEALAEAVKTQSVQMVRFALLGGQGARFTWGHSELDWKVVLRGPSEILWMLLDTCRQHPDPEAILYLSNIIGTPTLEDRQDVIRWFLDIFQNRKQMPFHIVQRMFNNIFRRHPEGFPRYIEWWELEQVQILLDQGADPCMIIGSEHYLRATQRSTPLLVAIAARSMVMVKLLISKGASANELASNGLTRTPLQMAAQVGSKPLVELLLHHGADIHAPCAVCGGATPLQLADIGGNVGLMERFLEFGVDPRAPGAKVEGRTALEGAAEYGRISAVKYLTDCCEYEAEECTSAMAFAEKNGHHAIVDLLNTVLDGRVPLAEAEQVDLSVDELLAMLNLDPGSEVAIDEPEVEEQVMTGTEYLQPHNTQRVEELKDDVVLLDGIHGSPVDDPMYDYDYPDVSTVAPYQPHAERVESVHPVLEESDEAIVLGLVPLQGSSNAPGIAPSDGPEKRFACHLCTKRFPRNDTLQRHVDRHTKKRFNCQHCAKHFSRKDVLNRHLRNDHDIVTRDT